ncbi:MAG: hypothetical protein WC343_10665 [Bacilli bacterium]
MNTALAWMMTGWESDDGVVSDEGKATSSPDRKLAIVTTPARTEAMLARTVRIFWKLVVIVSARIYRTAKKA